MKNYIQAGDRINYTPSGSSLSSGDPVMIGDLIAVAVTDIADGQTGACATAGVYELPKTTGTGYAISQGAKVYWDAAAGKVTYTDNTGANKYVGIAWADAGDSATTVQVKINA